MAMMPPLITNSQCPFPLPNPPPEVEGANESLRDFYVYWCRFMSAVLNFKSHLSELFAQALREVAPGAAQTEILIERPKQSSHGDYACSVAMQLAKPLHKSPRDIAHAGRRVACFRCGGRVEIAGRVHQCVSSTAINRRWPGGIAGCG